MTSPPPHGSEEAGPERDRMDEIAAYVEGRMTPEQEAAFEQRISEKESLRRKVETWREAIDAGRDWLGTAPPGLARVARLPIPSIAQNQADLANSAKRELSPKPRARVVELSFAAILQRGIAAAALLVLGIFIGRLTAGPADSAPLDPAPSLDQTVSRGGEAAGPALEQATPQNEPASGSPGDQPGNQDKPPVRRDAVIGETRLAAASPIRSIIEENGRLVIETENPVSGTRAVWFVEPSFRIARSSDQR